MAEVDFDRGIRDQICFGAGTQHPSKTSLDTRPSQRLHRPRHRETQWHEDLVYKQQSSPPHPKMKRQASKGRLLGIFTRAKSTRGAKTATEQERDGDHASVGQDGQFPATVTRSFSQNDSDGTTLDPIPVEKPIKQQPLMTKSSKSFKKDPSATKPIPWDPPPLFQAYPQSIKHTTAAAPAMSADAILRYQCDKKRRTKKRDTSREPRKSDGMNLDEEKSTDDGEDLLQLDQWSPKIYLLVTSGYFLQYAGEGSFDRLPEKIMPIGKDSAAFASDAVPGKHWVLQVSHSSDENGNPKIENSWSFFKRFGMGGDVKRCSASNFLLVLEHPTDLESWLSVVRKEIDSWGGKRYHHIATARPSDEEAALRLQQTSSRRYKVKRDPNQFSNDAQETSNTFGEATTDDVPSLPGHKFSTATQNSVHYSPSTSNETASTDQNNLGRLRNSPRMSTGAKTHSISGETSPNPSPTKPISQLSEFKFSHEPLALDDRMGTFSGQTSTQSSSQQPLEHTLSPTVPRPPSTGRSSRTPSNGAPNFSVPSFSKRYSSAHSTPPLSATSSSGSGNLPRKSMSPPAIDERDDAPPNFASSMADMDGEGSRLSRATAALEKEDDLVLVDDLKPPIPNTITQLSAADRTVPRRFSSLEYSRGISPSNFYPSPSASPHPPPTTALPALPESTDSMTSAPSRKLRRPISMQVHSFSSASTSANSEPLPTMGSPSVDDPTLYLPPPSCPPPPPTPVNESSSLHVPLTPNIIHNRRSMPHLSRPPSDPPDCPLPTPPVPKLPPIKLSTGSLRRSVERPLRAGLGRRAPGLVEGNEG
ncbi:MAG: hypothetical protein L6R38_001715 [Xanthoria sp. 2 TBL-2021]|nr:MAG: hypothetical protein L6R38_001715 [Xanthoria sp. 2 TBL-2021]